MSSPSEIPASDQGNWTGAIRRYVSKTWPWTKLLPSREPTYVNSWLYSAGALGVAAFILLVASGCVLALGGPQWWHHSYLGRVINSVHFWSVQLFFASIAIHLVTNFFLAAWRGGRWLTCASGCMCLGVMVITAFSGYCLMTNKDAQFIAINAKDAMNAMGAGWFFNVLDLGQMFIIHIAVFPLVLGGLTLGHILLVRKKGICPPIGFEHLDEREGTEEI